MNEKGFPGIGTLIEKGFTVIPAGRKSLPQARFLWEEALKHSRSALDKGATGELAGMIIACWREATIELLDEYLNALKTKIQDEEKEDIIGIASSLVYVAEKM